MDSTRQAMAVPTHIKSYDGLDNAFSGHEQVFSASKSVPKKGGKKDFYSPPEERKNLTTFSEKKQQVIDGLVAEFGDWFEETKQRFLSQLRVALVDEQPPADEDSDPVRGGGQRKCWNCKEPFHEARDCNQPRRKKRGKKKSRRLGVRERDILVSRTPNGIMVEF